MHPIIQDWDLSILTWLRAYQSPLVVWLAWVAATIAWKGVLLWVASLVLWVKGNRILASQFVVTLALCTLEVMLLKGIFLRARPDLWAAQQLHLPMPEIFSTEHSFPSGHVLPCAGIALLLTVRYRDWRAVMAWLLVFAVGLARVYQGLHWPSDVVGSVVLGVVAGWIALRICTLPQVSRLVKSLGSQVVSTREDAHPAKLASTSGSEATSSKDPAVSSCSLSQR